MAGSRSRASARFSSAKQQHQMGISTSLLLGQIEDTVPRDGVKIRGCVNASCHEALNKCLKKIQRCNGYIHPD